MNICLLKLDYIKIFKLFIIDFLFVLNMNYTFLIDFNSIYNYFLLKFFANLLYYEILEYNNKFLVVHIHKLLIHFNKFVWLLD